MAYLRHCSSCSSGIQLRDSEGLNQDNLTSLQTKGFTLRTINYFYDTITTQQTKQTDHFIEKFLSHQRLVVLHQTDDPHGLLVLRHLIGQRR